MAWAISDSDVELHVSLYILLLPYTFLLLIFLLPKSKENYFQTKNTIWYESLQHLLQNTILSNLSNCNKLFMIFSDKFLNTIKILPKEQIIRLRS